MASHSGSPGVVGTKYSEGETFLFETWDYKLPKQPEAFRQATEGSLSNPPQDPFLGAAWGRGGGGGGRQLHQGNYPWDGWTKRAPKSGLLTEVGFVDFATSLTRKSTP